MAVLNKIRKQSLVLIAVIALALFSFVLADLFKNSDALTSKSQNVVATIDGKDITREDFMAKVENLKNRQQGPVSSSQVMNSVYNQEVESILLESQFDALGLSVEKDQMRDALKNSFGTMPDFQNEAGLFDEDKLNEFIANLKAIAPESGFLNGQPINYQRWVQVENDLAKSYLRTSYLNMVKAGTTATLAEGELEYKLEGDKVDFKYVQIPFTSIADSTVAVSKSEIATYINNNPKAYEVEASRNINYVEFKEVASAEDEKEIALELERFLNGGVVYNEVTKQNDTIKGFAQITDNETFVNANSDVKYQDRYNFKSELPKSIGDTLFSLKPGSVYGPYKENAYYELAKVIAEKQMPDSVKVRHILIPHLGSTRADADVVKTEEQAKKTADSVLNAINRGKKFTDLLDLSSDKVSNEKNGEIEFAYGAAMAPEFKNFSFENKKGDVDVVKTSFGYHIIEILEQKNKQKAIKVGVISRKIEPSEATNDKVFRDASNFELAVSSKDFMEVAKESNYSVRPVNTIKELDENIPGLGNQRNIVKWAFEEGTEIGSVKRFNVPGGFAIVQVTGLNKKGLMNVEDASITALPIIRNEKKAQIIKDRISANTIEEVASAEKQTVRTAPGVNMKNPTVTGAGLEPLVVGTAFGLDVNETSGLIVGNKGVYMVQTMKNTPAPNLDNYQSFANQVSQQKQNAVNAQLLNALKETAEIEDNRAKTVQ